MVPVQRPMVPPWARHAHVALGLAGLTAAVVMLRHTDLQALRRAGPWAAFVVLIEGVRVLVEALATRSLHGRAVRVPWWPLLRTHLVGYALAMTMPAGRTVAEASKSAMLSPWVGTARSVGVGATNQALVMLATGLVAVPCSVAAWAVGHIVLAEALVAQGVALVAAGGALLVVIRSPAVGRWAQRKFPRWRVLETMGTTRPSAEGVWKAVGCFVLHRGVQVVQVGVMLAVLGHGGAMRTLGLTGAVIIGTSVGVAVPGQLGAIGAALALAGPGLGVTTALALAIALALHVAQFTWVALGFGVWALTRARTSPGA